MSDFMHIRSFDAETIPADNIPEECLPIFDPAEVAIPANWGTEAAQKKINAERDKFREKSKKDLGVKPEFCRPCSFVGYDSKSEEYLELFATNEEEEKKLLIAAWDWMREAMQLGITLVSFNGKSFDAQVLHRRSMMLDVHAIKHSMYLKLVDTRLENKAHVDVELSLGMKTPFSNKPILKKMEYWCAYFGVGAKPTGWDGSKVYPAYLAGMYEDILLYNKWDVDLLTGLFRRVESYIVD